MCLTILEDGGIITRFWGERTTQTHHIKLPWEKQSSPISTPVIFRVCHWDLLMVIVNQSLRVNWSFLDSKIYRWLSKEYMVQTSFLTEKNLWFQQIFPSKSKKILVAVNTNNSQFKKPINENQTLNILPKNSEQKEF